MMSTDVDRRHGKHITCGDEFFGNGSWDVNAVMQRMDQIHDSKFCDWVKCEDNIQLISLHLSKIGSQFPIRRIANGLRWVTANWSTTSVTKILQNMSQDWRVRDSAELVNLVTADWPLKPYTELVVREFVREMPASEAAVFVQVVSDDWDLEAVSELVSLLSCALKWEEKYFKDFTFHYILTSEGSVDSNLSAIGHASLDRSWAIESANSGMQEEIIKKRFMCAIETQNILSRAIPEKRGFNEQQGSGSGSKESNKMEIGRRFSSPEGSVMRRHHRKPSDQRA
jgi:hypothetical protein